MFNLFASPLGLLILLRDSDEVRSASSSHKGFLIIHIKPTLSPFEIHTRLPGSYRSFKNLVLDKINTVGHGMEGML